MLTVHKYNLETTNDQIIMLPVGSQIMCLKMILGAVFLYAFVDTKKTLSSHRIKMYGTGHEISKETGEIYLGTVHTSNGEFVWHIFEACLEKPKIT